MDPAAESGHCAAVGEALAHLHLAGADFKTDPRECAVARELAAALRACKSARRQRAARALREIANELDFLAKSWPDALPKA